VAHMKVVSESIESKNKALVLKVFDTLFNKRDYTAAEKFWSPDYIQHDAHIAPGREGLFISPRAFRQHSNMSQEPSFGPSIEITISAPRSPTRKCIKRDRPPFGLSFTNSRISRWSASAWRALPALRANSRKKIPLVFSELCRPII